MTICAMNVIASDVDGQEVSLKKVIGKKNIVLGVNL